MTETRTGGDPDRAEVRFTDLTPTQLEQKLEAMGTPAGDDTIRRWMDEHNLRLRKIRKVKAGGQSPDRDSQFQNIAQLIEDYRQAGNPCFSVDTKANCSAKVASAALKPSRPSITTSPVGPTA